MGMPSTRRSTQDARRLHRKIAGAAISFRLTFRGTKLGRHRSKANFRSKGISSYRFRTAPSMLFPGKIGFGQLAWEREKNRARNVLRPYLKHYATRIPPDKRPENDPRGERPRRTCQVRFWRSARTADLRRSGLPEITREFADAIAGL